MALVGMGVMLINLDTPPDATEPLVQSNHQGAALWWIGTAILFAAVLESWSRDRNSLILTAGILATLSAFLGASYTLYHDNVPLLVLLSVGATYSLIFGFIGVFLRIVSQRIISLVRILRSRRPNASCAHEGPRGTTSREKRHWSNSGFWSKARVRCFPGGHEMMRWAGKISAALPIVLFCVWAFLTLAWAFPVTVLLTGLLPGWGLNNQGVLWLLGAWVVAGGWYGAWKTRYEFQTQVGFSWRDCRSKATLTMTSNMLVSAMATPTLFITTSSILQATEKSINESESQELASILAWGSLCVSLLVAIVSLIVLNEYIHSAVSRKVGMIRRATENPPGD